MTQGRDRKFPALTITKVASSILISEELLKDGPRFHFRAWTEEEWRGHITDLVGERVTMDAVGASPADKRRQTWRIKRAEKVGYFPHLTIEYDEEEGQNG